MAPWKAKAEGGEHRVSEAHLKDPRERWLSVTGLPVIAVSPIEQAVSFLSLILNRARYVSWR